MNARRVLAVRRRRDEAGYVAILVALFAATILMPLCAMSVDVARWYVEVQRVQNAADAAATAGVTYLPDDFASAQSTAVTVAGRNGYPNSGKTSVSVAVGSKPTQLTVTISSTIGNAFGASFGVGSNTIVRSATADYNGPAPMGSPCNAFGNEPAGSSSDTTRGPSGSVITSPAGGAVCTSTPQFWAAIAGPDTPKGNGDEYATRTCNTGNDGCSGTTNNEFDPRGYFYIVRVTSAAVGTPITVQLYDPAWVETGNNCEKAPDNTSALLQDDMNDYTSVDGTTRYAQSANNFCTGDVDDVPLDSKTGKPSTTDYPIVTSYDLRQPTDTYQPSNGTPITGCTRQYPGYLDQNYSTNQVNTDLLRESLTSGKKTKPNPDYSADLAKVYHQWVPLCTFTPTQVGDYYLQVRTDVPLAGSSDGQGGFTGNANVYAQTGDNSAAHGIGNNRFSIRVKGAPAASVSVAGWQHMSIYANYTGANTFFNMVRVIPAAASKTLKIVFYDVGDVATGTVGTITVLPPTDSNLGGTLTSCTGAGVANGPLPGCKLTNVSSVTYNGKQQVITVPIPNTYTCNATQPGGCWYRLLVSFPGGVQDTTTWSASIDGDPIRLIK